MDAVADSPVEKARVPRSPFQHAWCCTNHYRLRLPRAAAGLLYQLGEHSRAVAGTRVVQETWARYSMVLAPEVVAGVAEDLARRPPRVEPLHADVIAEFTALCPQADQIATAHRLWQHGLRRAFVARASDGRPQAFLWVLTSADNARLRQLPSWAGIYTPIPPGWVQLENAFSIGRTLARGRLMTELAYSAVLRSEPAPRGILAHMGEHNRVVRRWIESLGCQLDGTIARVRLELPVLRRHPLYVHTVAMRPRLEIDIKPAPRRQRAKSVPLA